MIIWRGKGIVIAFIVFGCLLLTELMTRRIFAGETYYQDHGWPKLAALWVAAGIVYWLQSWFRGEMKRTSIEQTGEEINLTPESSLFFVPVRLWPALLLGLGVGAFFMRG